MSREIKFRAWVKASERMCPQVGVDPFHVNDLDRLYWNHDQVILMQFTGLHDKNGKEIYEGDIVKWVDGKWEKGDGWEKEYTGNMIWEQGAVGFRVQMPKGYMPFKLTAEALEIIGNIYEHPYLLTSKTPNA